MFWVSAVPKATNIFICNDCCFWEGAWFPSQPGCWSSWDWPVPGIGFALQKLLWQREHLLEIPLESLWAACSRVWDLSPRAQSSDKNLLDRKFWRSVAVFWAPYRKAHTLFSGKICILTERNNVAVWANWLGLISLSLSFPALSSLCKFN